MFLHKNEANVMRAQHAVPLQFSNFACRGTACRARIEAFSVVLTACCARTNAFSVYILFAVLAPNFHAGLSLGDIFFCLYNLAMR
jgi:hypothetical protein